MAYGLTWRDHHGEVKKWLHVGIGAWHGGLGGKSRLVWRRGETLQIATPCTLLALFADQLHHVELDESNRWREERKNTFQTSYQEPFFLFIVRPSFERRKSFFPSCRTFHSYTGIWKDYLNKDKKKTRWCSGYTVVNNTHHHIKPKITVPRSACCFATAQFLAATFKVAREMFSIHTARQQPSSRFIQYMLFSPEILI